MMEGKQGGSIETSIGPEVNEDIKVDDVLAWADGIMGVLGTEHANTITDQEARIAWAITNAPR